MTEDLKQVLADLEQINVLLRAELDRRQLVLRARAELELRRRRRQRAGLGGGKDRDI